MSASLLSEELQNDLDYLREYPIQGDEVLAKLLKDFDYWTYRCLEVDEMDSEEEKEVRCFCPECQDDGWCHVSTRRALELEMLDLVETCCPYGDRCAALQEDSDSDSDSDED